MEEAAEIGAPRTMTTEVISSIEADALFAPLLKYDKLLLAVSGGSDSMAMLELVADWRARKALPKPFVSVATVDHHLRAQSRAEAEFVAARCRTLGLVHVILDWAGIKPASGVANAAREARYRLLHEHAKRAELAGLCAVVTAHTEDDQAETFVMRLARGSGVDGLAAMAPVRPLQLGSPVALARPLLGMSKTRLAATLTARGLSWRDDDSNSDPKSERVRMRAAMPSLVAAGVHRSALVTSARRMRLAADALAYAEDAFTRTLSIDLHDEVYACLDRANFAAGPAWLGQRVLQRLIGRFGGDTPAPLLAEIEDLAHRLMRDDATRATLGGVVFQSTSRNLKAWREAGRISDDPLNLAAGASVLWDKRFWLSREGRPEIAVAARALGAAGVGVLRNHWPDVSRAAPAAALASLPSFWTGGSLIAVPGVPGVFASDADAHGFTAPEGLTFRAEAAHRASSIAGAS